MPAADTARILRRLQHHFTGRAINCREDGGEGSARRAVWLLAAAKIEQVRGEKWPQAKMATHPDDHLVGSLAANLHLVRDPSGCLVIVGPGIRCTVSNVDTMIRTMEDGKVEQLVYKDECERQRLLELAQHRREHPQMHGTEVRGG